MTKEILFKIENLKKYFPLKKRTLFEQQRYVRANENISINIYKKETLGLVGESGCGKSTLGRTILQLHEQTEGTTLYYGKTIQELAPAYSHKLIADLPKTFPGYYKAVEELEDLYEKRESATKEEDIHKLEDQLMQKRRQVQINYLNTIRIAGGLLVHEDLTKVSQVLKDQYSYYKNIARINQRLDQIGLHLKDSGYKKQYTKLEEEKKKLLDERSKEEQGLKEATAKVENLRDSVRDKEGFEGLESRKDDGVDLSELGEREMRLLRKDLQMIFQDPYSSLDTKLTVGNIIGEGVMAHDMFKSADSEGYDDYIQQIMAQCGLAPYFIHRYPHQFSGGQRQRIGIARALAVQPEFIVCDESVSALDVSIQSQVINLLQDLKDQNDLTYLFITHDLSVVKYISDRIAVMYLGNIVELAETEKLFDSPSHPYTKALLNAIPRTDVDSNQTLSILEGDIPSAVNPPPGCKFHTRCKYKFDRCQEFEPNLQDIGDEHFVACHLMDMAEEERKSYMDEIDKEEEARLEKEDDQMFEAL